MSLLGGITFRRWTIQFILPEFDDGLDAGDIKRSDSEILDEIWESLGDSESEMRNFEIIVRGAEVFIKGQVDNTVIRERLINLVLTIPGVRNVYDGISVAPN
jgi:osmotically-inducible protein OsmY